MHFKDTGQIPSNNDNQERLELLRDQHRTFDVVNGYTGYEDGVTCAKTCNWLVYLSIYNALLNAGGSANFLDEAERSKFSPAEFAAAKFSGFVSLDEYQEFDALARGFFASYSQNATLPLPSDSYVKEFVFALEDNVEIWEKANDDSDSAYEK